METHKDNKNFLNRCSSVLVVISSLLLAGAIVFFLYAFCSHRKALRNYEKLNNELVLFDFYIDEEMYPDMAPYVFANDYDFLYTYGEDMEDELVECSGTSLMLSLPRTFELFLSEGGRIILSHEDFLDMIRAIARDDFHEDVSGIYFRDSLNDKKPTICVSYEAYAIDSIYSVFLWGDTEVHELTHYMDDIYGFSKTDEFIKFFRLYAADYEPRSCVTENYQTKSEKEFFAILVTDILKVSEIETLNMPDELLEYMRTVFLTAEGIDITE